MNLIIDIGNSMIKAALVQDGQVLCVERYGSAQELDSSSLFDRYQELTKAIVASTGVPTAPIAEMLRQKGVPYVLEMTSLTPVPIGNDYLTPESLGVDRLAAAVGAMEIAQGQDCLIVDFGTAITIDLVQDGVFKGGNISPGVELRFKALRDYTSRLPKCEATEEVLDFGGNTVQAIEQGVMQGITNEIEGYISKIYAINVNLLIIFTGGDAKYFVKRIKNTIFAKYDLVVCGLNRILEYNAKPE
jgi:type III pantothenate kinase